MIDPRRIPAELKEMARWVVWRRVVRDGKPTKVPCDADGYDLDATNPAAWVDFETACERARRWDGIGFAIGGSGLVGVDLDHCLDPETGKVEDWALDLVCRVDSYTEITPSGTGLHIWARGSLPPKGRRKGHIEMYDSGRYFTVTGHHLDATPCAVYERAAELAAIHAELFPPAPERPPLRAVPPPLAMDDRSILDRMLASRNGAKIGALLRGDAAGYLSGSEADLALCSHLAFWCGKDIDAIDRIFRQSGLCDEKWLERDDYRQRTIEKALEGAGTYDPNYRDNGHATGNGYAHPNGNGAVHDREPGGADEDAPNRTDLGNARRLVTRHGTDLRHCHPWGKWLIWRGDRWQADETASIFRRARDVVRAIHAEVAQEPDEAVRKALAAWAITSESEKRINSMVSLARQEPSVPVLPDQFDADPWLLNCPNGTLDLRTGAFRPHERADLLTKRTGIPYDPDATCLTWDAFLDRIMEGNRDMIAFLSRAVGYSLTGDVSEHALFFLYGRGRNGKSTFIGAIQHILGDYAITINADLLTARSGDEHPTGVADLQGRRFVATIEVEDGRRMAEALVKTLTGGDRIRARRMRQDFYEFPPTHKLFLAANHKPTVNGTDDGIWRRIKLIPFAVQIPPEEVDRDLPGRLQAEGPGILAWAVRGLREWRELGLAEPAAVTEATAGYREEMDTLAAFLVERCVLSKDCRARPQDLYRDYAQWCEGSGTKPVAMRRFGLQLSERGIELKKSNSVAWRVGIGLRADYG